MARTTRDIYEEAYKWAIKQRLDLGNKRDVLTKGINVSKKQLKEVESEIKLLDDVLQTLNELRENGGVDEEA